MKRISSFPPIIFKDSKILILGSVPGIKSLEMQEYYAHPQNKFWTILFEIFDENFTRNYNEKIKFLEKNKIAVWDVIDSCEREGSLDTKIKNESHNDIAELLKVYPKVQTIFCNGQKSFKNLKKMLGEKPTVSIYVLPSTSPAHAIPFEKKLSEWSEIKNFV